MSCDVGKVTERLENELCSPTSQLCSFSKLSVTSSTSQLILQPFRRFIYVTAHSPTLPLVHLRHSSFSNPSFASTTSQALHLIHLASRPWSVQRHFRMFWKRSTKLEYNSWLVFSVYKNWMFGQAKIYQLPVVLRNLNKWPSSPPDLTLFDIFLWGKLH